MGYKPPYTITSKILSLVSRITEEIVKLEYKENQIITPYLRKKNRIKTLAGTLEIEGNFLGEEKITAILDGKRVLGTMLEVTEVEGAIKAYKELDNYNYNKLESLLYAHEILMDNILKDAGSFRMVNVGVGNKDGVTHVAPPPNQVPKLMRELFEWLKNSDEHYLIKSCVFHYEFEFIHPFSDGNGRIGRLWQSVILNNWKKIFSSLPTESIIRDNQERYYKAIEDSSNIGESTPFIEFMLEVLLKTILLSLEQNDQVDDQVSDQVKKLLDILDDEWLSVNEMMEKLGLKHKATFRKNYLNPALELKYIVMKEPDSPRSPKQKYKKIVV
jgi:Fic family protein